MRLCIDLNVWCAAVLAIQANRAGTAARTIVEALGGKTVRGPIQVVVSWGMLDRLKKVLVQALDISAETADPFVAGIVSYAVQGPSLTLGGVGVLPIHDPEDRHVLETAWAGRADVLVSMDFEGFGADGEMLVEGRLKRLNRAEQALYLIHPFTLAAWLRGEGVEGFEPEG